MLSTENMLAKYTTNGLICKEMSRYAGCLEEFQSKYYNFGSCSITIGVCWK